MAPRGRALHVRVGLIAVSKGRAVGKRTWLSSGAVSHSGGRGWRHYDRNSRRLTAWQRRLLGSIPVLIVGLAIAFLVFSWMMPSAARLRIVASGIASYSDPAVPENRGADQDLALFHGLEAEFDKGVVSTWEDVQSSSALLQRLEESPANLRGNLVMYASFHGLVLSDQRLYWLTADADAASLDDNSASGRVAFRDVLARLESSGAERVLLLLDLNRLSPSLRLAAFAGDVPDYVRRELESHARENAGSRITIICSSESNQQSHVSPETGASIFAECVEKALRGEADGWTGSGGNGSRNHRVNADEIFHFVRATVQDWSRSHRSLPQTVVRFGDPTDFVLVTRPRVGKVVAAKKEGDPTTPPPAPQVASTNGGKDHRTDAQPGREASPQPAKPPTEKSPPTNPSPAPPGEPATTAETSPTLLSLIEQWNRKDQMIRESLQLANSVALSEAQWHLWRAARREAAGLVEPTQVALRGASDRLRDSSAQTSDVAADGRREQMKGPAAWWRLRPVSVSPEQSAQFALQLQQAEARAAAKPEDAAKADRPSAPAGGDLDYAAFAEWLSQQLAERGPSAAQALLASELPTPSLPQELQLLRELGARSRVFADSVARGAIQRIAAGHRRVREIAAKHSGGLGWLAQDLGRCYRGLDAAERWLLAQQASDPEVIHWLDQTDARLNDVAVRAGQIDDARQLVCHLFLELPHWARLAAVEAELSSDSLTLATTGPSAGSFLPIRWASHPDAELQERMTALIDAAMRLLTAQTTAESAASESSLDEFLTHATRARAVYDSVHREWDDRRSELLSERLTPANRLRAVEWSTCPCLSNSVRQRFLELLKKPTATVPLPIETSHARQGLWQAYWAIQVLRLGGLDARSVDELWENWQKWAREAESDNPLPAEQIGALQAELGRMIRGGWNRLQRAATSGSAMPRFDALCVLAEPLPSARNAYRSALSAAEQQRHLSWYAVVREDLRRRRGRSTTSQSYGEQLLALVPAVSSEAADPSSAAPDFEIKPERLVLNAQRRGTVSLRATGLPQGAEPRVWFRDTGLELVGSGSTSDVLPFPETDPLTLEFRAPSGERIPNEMLLALVSPDRFPYRFHRLAIVRPLDPSDWRFEMVNAATGQRLHHERVSEDRAVGNAPANDDERADRIRFFLPPQANVQLRCELVRPADDAQHQGTLRVFRLPPISQPGASRSLLCELPALTLPGGAVRTKLELQGAAGGVAGAAEQIKEGEPKQDSPPKAMDSMDLSSGLLFELELEEGAKVTQVLKPVFWSHMVFIDEPQIAFDGDQLSITVTRKTAPPQEDADCLLPPEIEVQLAAPAELLAAATKQYVLSIVSKAGQTSPQLSLQLAPQLRAQVEGRNIEVALDVAGVPHAYRWWIRPGEPDRPRRLQMESPLRIASPTAGRILNAEKDAFDLKLQVNAPALDEADGKGTVWRLSYELQHDRDGETPAAGPAMSWRLTASRLHRVELSGLQAGVWSIRTATEDFVVPRLPGGLSGRFLVHARLEQNDTVVDEQRIRLAIAGGQAPTVDWISAPMQHQSDRPLELAVRHRDEISGIQRVAVGFDVNANRQLDQTEELAERPYKVFDDRQQRWIDNVESRLTIPAAGLPKEEGRYRLVASATNGAGVTAHSEVRIVTLKPRPVPVAKTTGTLIVQFGGRKGKKTLTLTGPSQPGTVASQDAPQHVYKDLAPGAYKLKVTAYGGVKLFDDSVTVEAGKAATVSAK